MARPTLTFVCELGRDRVEDFFADGAVVGTLQDLGARVALALADFSPPRAQAVRQLNDAGVPVTAIPLLPAADGHYFTAEHPDLARGRYLEWQAWARSEGLVFAGVGLDIEPDIAVYQQMAENARSLPKTLLLRVLDRDGPARAAQAYRELVDEIRSDGGPVENYQFPLLADERRVRSSGLERLFGLVDVSTDREVWMLYSSFPRRLGPGFIWAYGLEAAAIAVGSTGGGPDIPDQPQVPALSYDELSRDLRLAARWTDQVYVHSLEGCVDHGYLDRLAGFDWAPGKRPALAGTAAALRMALRGTLGTTAHLRQLELGASVAVAGLRVLRRRAARRAHGPSQEAHPARFGLSGSASVDGPSLAQSTAGCRAVPKN